MLMLSVLTLSVHKKKIMDTYVKNSKNVEHLKGTTIGDQANKLRYIPTKKFYTIIKNHGI